MGRDRWVARHRWTLPGASRLAATGLTVWIGLLVGTAPAEASATSQANGWSMVTVRPVPGAAGASFSAISCFSARNCFAVGSSYAGYLALAKPGSVNADVEQHPLIEHFDGQTWSLVASPDLAGALNGITCPSASLCLAVGGSAHPDGAVTATLVERFDGTSWSLMPSPDATLAPPAGVSDPSQWVVSNHLDSVSCLSVTNCVAVGGTSGSDAWRGSGVETVAPPLSEHYDGSSWSIVPVDGTYQGSLVSVSCAHSDCLAVGLDEPISADLSSGHFTGRYAEGRWQRLDAPQAEAAGIAAVDCRPGHSCVGVGGGPDRAYAVQLFQRGWLTQRTAPLDRRIGSLWGLSCTTTGSCVAVGTSKATGNVTGATPNLNAPLIEEQGAKSWRTLEVRPPDGRYYVLQSVSCVAHDRCVAVGYVQAPNIELSGDAEPLVMSGR